jgi:hypothetical protein
VQHVGHVSAVVVVGEQRALNILGGTVGTQEPPPAAVSASCGSKGLPPGGAKITQFLRGVGLEFATASGTPGASPSAGDLVDTGDCW